MSWPGRRSMPLLKQCLIKVATSHLLSCHIWSLKRAKPMLHPLFLPGEVGERAAGFKPIAQLGAQGGAMEDVSGCIDPNRAFQNFVNFPPTKFEDLCPVANSSTSTGLHSLTRQFNVAWQALIEGQNDPNQLLLVRRVRLLILLLSPAHHSRQRLPPVGRGGGGGAVPPCGQSPLRPADRRRL